MSRIASSSRYESGRYSPRQLNRDCFPSSFGVQSTSTSFSSANTNSSVLMLQADPLSAGLRPLVCLAGVLESFRDGADDILRRFAGVRLSASTVRRATQQAGQQLAQQQQQGDIATAQPVPAWDFAVQGHRHTVASPG